MLRLLLLAGDAVVVAVEVALALEVLGVFGVALEALGVLAVVAFDSPSSQTLGHTRFPHYPRANDPILYVTTSLLHGTDNGPLTVYVL